MATTADPTRRDVLEWLLVGGAGLAWTGPLTGCAIDPVTGKRTFVGMSEAQEIAIDRQQSPYQFSADLGAVQDHGLNTYLDSVGREIGLASHRPQMPYSFRAVNAAYVNAYTFPGGAAAVTRGILVEIEDESQLAALLGHEIGHVNARHTAERAGRTMIAQALVAGAMIAMSTQKDLQDWAGLANVAGTIGASAFLARYSRDNEREADALGMEYVGRTGRHPGGMVGLMAMLRRQSERRPSLLETMFSSHPMSDERYETARRRLDEGYGGGGDLPRGRERYMDETARLRRVRGVIRSVQQGDEAMARREPERAAGEYESALREHPDDYGALVQMARCEIVRERHGSARTYLGRARSVYPAEAQAVRLDGINEVAEGRYDRALAALDLYDARLPGSPEVAFLRGYCLERTGRRAAAAEAYAGYLRAGGAGPQGEHARAMLIRWGYLEAPPAQ